MPWPNGSSGAQDAPTVLVVTYRTLDPARHLWTSYTVEFRIARVLVRYLRSLREGAVVDAIAERDPLRVEALAYTRRLTRAEMQERLGVSGDDDS